jgi:hypothetical protein
VNRIAADTDESELDAAYALLQRRILGDGRDDETTEAWESLDDALQERAIDRMHADLMDGVKAAHREDSDA